MYDPFGIFDEEPKRPGLAAPQGGGPSVPPLKPEEADSLLSRAANSGLGALHYVGSTIDKTFGGRAIRAGLKGMMGGDVKGSELLSMIPFSDKMGLTDEANRVSGEDLLKQAGVLQGEGTKGTFEMRDLAGPLAEMALDPSTYLTLGTSGALTKAGQQASKMGIMPAKATQRIAGFAAGTPELTALAAKMAVPEAELAGKALSGVAGIGLPFSHPSTILGTGDTGKALAGWMERQADKALYGKVGTTLSRLFDSRVHKAQNASTQRVMREIYDPAMPKGIAEAYSKHLDAGKYLESTGLLDHTKTAQMRRLVEGIDPIPQGGSAQQAFVDFLDQMNKKTLDDATAVGRKLTPLEDQYAKYGHRQITAPEVPTKGYENGTRKSMNPHSANQVAREDVLRDFVEGTDGINKMAKDAHLRGLVDDTVNPTKSTLDAAQHIRRSYLGMTPAQEAEMFFWAGPAPHPVNDPAGYARWLEAQNEHILVPAANGTATVRNPNPVHQEWQKRKATWKQADDLVNYARDLDPAYAKNQWDLFGNHPLADFTHGQLAHERAQNGARAIHELLATNVVPAGADTVSLREALKAVQLDHEVLDQAGQVTAGGTKYLADLLKKKDPSKWATVGTNDLDKLHVPRSVIEDANRFTGAPASPEAMNALVKLWDSATNLTKAGQTSLWPGFHTRNMVTGLWQNIVSGARDPNYHKLNPMGYVRPYLDAVALRNNGVIPKAADIYKGIHPNITDAEATRLLAEEMFQHSARINAHGTQAAEAIGKSTLGNPVPIHLPGTGHEKPLLDVINPAVASRETQKLGTGKYGGVGVRGVGDATETTLLPVRMGQELGAAGDDLNRISSYIAHRRGGVEAAEASARSRAAHYDYSKLTDFERNVMRRIIPFYSWSRQNVPYQIAELAARPGGVTGSAVKGLDSLRATGGFVPENVSEGMAIPLGQEEDGKARFATHFGLPIEDAFSFLGTGGNPIQRSGEKLLGMANPLIKMPAEVIAGKQMYSGRHLEDLYSPTGNILLDQAVMNSPLSRAATTARQAADPRKSWGDFLANFIGPAKFTDVDTVKARELAGRDLITSTLKAGNDARSFETMYVPKENLQNLSPEEMRLYQLYKYLEAKRQADARAAKKKQGVSQ